MASAPPGSLLECKFSAPTQTHCTRNSVGGAQHLCLTNPPGDSAWPGKGLLPIRDHTSFILVSVSVSYYNCNKLWQPQWLKTTQMYYLMVLESRSSKSVLVGVKSRCWYGCVPSGQSRGESISLPFPAYRGRPYSLAHHCIPLTSTIIVTLSPLTLLPSSYKSLCDYKAPTLKILNDLPI